MDRLPARAPAARPARRRPAGTLDDEIYLGDRTEWRVRVGEEVVTVAEPAGHGRGRRRGDAVTVGFPPAAVLRLQDPGA